MATTPTTVNTVADIVNDIISGSIAAAEKVGETALETSYPILAAPVIKQVVEYLIERELNLFFTIPIKEAFTKLVIDIQTNQESSACAQAILALESAMKSGDQNAINGAKSNMDKAFQDLIGWDGSSTNAST